MTPFYGHDWRSRNLMAEPNHAVLTAAGRRIRLTGLRRKKPWQRGFFYALQLRGRLVRLQSAFGYDSYVSTTCPFRSASSLPHVQSPKSSMNTRRVGFDGTVGPSSA